MMKETRSGLSDNTANKAVGNNGKPDMKNIWRLFLFFLLYIIFRLVVETMFTLSTLTLGPSFTEGLKNFMLMSDGDGGYRLTGDMQVIIAGIGYVMSGIMIRRKAFEYDKKFNEKKENKLLFWVLTAAASVGLALFLNIIISKSGVTAYSETYTEVAASQYSCSFIVGLIMYGFISPVSEELMFRGILYNGLKRFFNPNSAMFISAAIFGLYHGNGVQAFYGFLVSAFIVLIYDLSGDLRSAFLIHMACNLTAYILTYVYASISSNGMWIIAIVSFAVLAGCYYLMIGKNAKKKGAA